MPVEMTEMDVITEPCRLAFPFLAEKRKRSANSDRLTYQAVALLPPDFDRSPLIDAVKAAMMDKWGKLIRVKENPIRRCEDKHGDLDGYEPGWFHINLHSGYQPGMVDQKRQEVLDPKEVFYPGCWVRFHIKAYAWQHQEGGPGVSFSLEALQFVKDDTRFDGRKDPKDVFDPIEIDEDDANEEQLFGAEDIFG